MAKNEINVLADELTRLLIGDPNGYKNFEHLLSLVSPNFNVQKPTDYNKNFADLRKDLIPVVEKYFFVK